MNHSRAIHEPFMSGSITVQFRLEKVSQVQKGSCGTTHENSVTPSLGSPASDWTCKPPKIRGPKPRPIAERLADQLLRMPNGCLEWQGSTDTGGYGVITIGSRVDGTRRQAQVHRLTWEMANGPIPEGLRVLHHCDNPPCCDAWGGCLFLGTQADNMADMMAKGRGSNGH